MYTSSMSCIIYTVSRILQNARVPKHENVLDWTASTSLNTITIFQFQTSEVSGVLACGWEGNLFYEHVTW